MEFKLNIYNGKTIEKTYTADDFHLMTGTCEDILKLIDIDNMKLDNVNDNDTLMQIVTVVTKAFNEFNPLMKQVFDGLTDDEYRRTRIIDVAQVIMDVLTSTFAELFKAYPKN